MSKTTYKTTWKPNTGRIQLSQSELEKSYRTLIGKSVLDDSEKIIGTIIDAELVAGNIEIVFEANQLNAVGIHKEINPTKGFVFKEMYLSSVETIKTEE